jgi:hypothetical protein
MAPGFQIFFRKFQIWALVKNSAAAARADGAVDRLWQEERGAREGGIGRPP